jgi:hypothetical protein
VESSAVRIVDEIRVSAPLAAVWWAVEDPAAHASWHPFVTQIAGGHRLDEVRTCSVLVGAKPGRTRERCVEHEKGRRIIWAVEQDSTGFGRMVTGWRAGFSLTSIDGATIVTAESRFDPRNVLVRATLPLIRRKFHQTQQAILHGLKDSLEGAATAASPLPISPGPAT